MAAAKSSGGAKAPSSGGAGGSVTKVSYKSPSSNDAPTWRQAYDMSNQQLDRGVEQGRETARQAANAGLQRDRINAGQAAASQPTKTQEMNLGFQNSLMFQKNSGMSAKGGYKTGPSMDEKQFEYQRNQGEQDRDMQYRQMEEQRMGNAFARHDRLDDRNMQYEDSRQNRASNERVAGMNAGVELQKARYGMMGSMFGSLSQHLSGSPTDFRYW